MTDEEIIGLAIEYEKNAATSDGPVHVASFTLGARVMRASLPESVREALAFSEMRAQHSCNMEKFKETCKRTDAILKGENK